VQLHNPTQVAAEWGIKRPAVDSPKLRDWQFFVPEPPEGVLEPGARVNVRVTFTPQVRVSGWVGGWVGAWVGGLYCLLESFKVQPCIENHSSHRSPSLNPPNPSPPNQSTNQAGRNQPYTLTLPIKIANNPKPRELACTGRGFTPRIEIAPTVVDCGPILPAFPGQRPAEGGLVITNPTDQAVEVVCLDLDGRQREDEEALRSLEM